MQHLHFSRTTRASRLRECDEVLCYTLRELSLRETSWLRVFFFSVSGVRVLLDHVIVNVQRGFAVLIFVLIFYKWFFISLSLWVFVCLFLLSRDRDHSLINVHSQSKSLSIYDDRGLERVYIREWLDYKMVHLFCMLSTSITLLYMRD